MYETIKKFLDEGGKCLLIEDGKPIGVVLTMEEYELLRSKSQNSHSKSQTSEQLLIPRINNEPVVNPNNPIGAAMVEEMDFPDLPADSRFAVGFGEARALAKAEVSAELSDIDFADEDDVNFEDLGLDELPY